MVWLGNCFLTPRNFFTLKSLSYPLQMNTTSSEHETSSGATLQSATKSTRTFALCISILGLLGNVFTFKIISKYKDQTSGTTFIKALSVLNSIVLISFGFLPIFSILGLDLMTLSNYVCIPWIFFSALSGISGEWLQMRSVFGKS